MLTFTYKQHIKLITNLSEIVIFGTDAIQGMRNAGKLAKLVLDFIEPYVKEGISTNELNTLCHDFILSNNASPAPLNYNGFPKSVCTSVNDVVCHGIPGAYKLRSGDIINIDVTVILDGWYGDTSRTFLVGNCTHLARDLVEITKKAMYVGIDAVKIGGHIGDIGCAIQKYISNTHYSIVRDYGGHGIGNFFHGEPFVAHYDTGSFGAEIKPGMFFTIEPMINAGKYKCKVLKDGWTAVTVDKSLSAQFEHTIAITEDGVEILTA